MILIATAGRVGAEAARLLIRKDEPVRVLVREPDNAIALRRLRVDIAKGDLDDPASIEAAMRGVTSVVLVRFRRAVARAQQGFSVSVGGARGPALQRTTRRVGLSSETPFLGLNACLGPDLSVVVW